MMCRFIGLVGHAGAGKDTVADILSRKYGYRKAAFADELKYLYGLKQGFRGTRRKVIKMVNMSKNRDELIEFGMSRRNEDPDIWVRALDKRIQQLDKFHRDLRAPLPRWVITDIRFENELNLVRNKFHGIIIKVTAPLETRLERMKRRGDIVRDLDFMKHESEQLADKIKPDFTVDNSGSLADLAGQLFDIMHLIR